MAAMMAGSFSNIILDYIFMFPLGMGMFGAVLATCLAPIISLGILALHFFPRRKGLDVPKSKPAWNLIPDMCTLGLSALISEVSGAVVLITFNLVILALEGSLGVAAHGIVANLALVGIAVFTGLTQGAQPLFSRFYGMRSELWAIPRTF
jgi:Na+-driven multidrug efflux pump